MEEDLILQELAEMVIIMQEEAEMLIEVSDLVEEYCEEIELEAEVKEMEEWVFELGAGHNVLTEGSEVNKSRPGREDSGIELEEDPMLDQKHVHRVGFLDDKSLEEVSVFDGPRDHFRGCNRDSKVTTPSTERFFSRKGGDIKDEHIRAKKKTTSRKETAACQKSQATRGEPERNKPTTKKPKMKRVPPPFRDSGLGLQSPRGQKPPLAKWI